MGIARIDGGPPDRVWGGPSAVLAGNLVFTSGLLATDGIEGLARKTTAHRCSFSCARG
jgi:hypothetical protein